MSRVEPVFYTECRVEQSRPRAENLENENDKLPTQKTGTFWRMT